MQHVFLEIPKPIEHHPKSSEPNKLGAVGGKSIHSRGWVPVEAVILVGVTDCYINVRNVFSENAHCGKNIKFKINFMRAHNLF